MRRIRTLCLLAFLTLFMGIPCGRASDTIAQNHFQHLQSLQNEAPDLFKVLIERRKEKMRSMITHIKENRSKEYEELRKQVREQRIERWQYLKRNHPERFEALLKQKGMQ